MAMSKKNQQPTPPKPEGQPKDLGKGKRTKYGGYVPRRNDDTPGGDELQALTQGRKTTIRRAAGATTSGAKAGR